MRRDMVPRLAFAALSAALLAACGGGGPSAPQIGTGGGGNGPAHVVTIGASTFTPASITVPVNGSVTWNWNSCTTDANYNQTCIEHSVAFDDTTIAGSVIQSSGSFAKTFTAAGVYKYHCAVHGAAMAGTVTVQ